MGVAASSNTGQDASHCPRDANLGAAPRQGSRLPGRPVSGADDVVVGGVLGSEHVVGQGLAVVLAGAGDGDVEAGVATRVGLAAGAGLALGGYRAEVEPV